MGIEPTRPAWKAGILPLNYTRISTYSGTVSLYRLPYFKRFVNTFFRFFCTEILQSELRPVRPPEKAGGVLPDKSAAEKISCNLARLLYNRIDCAEGIPLCRKGPCAMIFVPLLHYFKCKNTYSGNEYGLRYRLTPGKRTLPDPDGGADAVKEESILTLDYWPDPWTLEMTDPALRRQEIFPLTDEGRAAAAHCLEEAFRADPDRWKNCPDMLDCDPWTPPADTDATE